MSTTVLGLLIGVIGACVTGIVTWRIAKRNTSGTVATSDATTLWTASNQIRQDLAAELSVTRDKVGNLEGRLDLLTQQHELLRGKHDECQRNEALLRQRVTLLEETVERRVPTRPVRKQAAARRRSQ